jgi:hypothetical protein
MTLPERIARVSEFDETLALEFAQAKYPSKDYSDVRAAVINRMAFIEGARQYADEIRPLIDALGECVTALNWIEVGHKGGPKIGAECQRKASEALAALERTLEEYERGKV